MKKELLRYLVTPVRYDQSCWTTYRKLASKFPVRVVEAKYPHPGRRDGSERSGDGLPVRLAHLRNGVLIPISDGEIYNEWQAKNALSGGDNIRLVVHPKSLGVLKSEYMLVMPQCLSEEAKSKTIVVGTLLDGSEALAALKEVK